MKPGYTLAELAEIRPDLHTLESSTITLGPSDCLARLPVSYFDEYDPATVAEHVQELCSLSVEQPFTVRVRKHPEPDANSAQRHEARYAQATIFAFDVEGMLGLLTGVLGVCGLDIQAGSVHTLLRSNPSSSRTGGRSRVRRRGAGTPPPVLPSRRIVDQFAGYLPENVEVEDLEETITESLSEVLPLMLPGGDRERARRTVNEAVADRLRADEAGSSSGLFPVRIKFSPADSYTRMTIIAEDTPFFLYSLSTALSLQGVSIEGVQIGTDRNLISDTLYLSGRSGEPISDPQKLDRIRLSVLLTKQFTYFLGNAPDPYAALVRFESMSQEIVAATEREGLRGVLSQPLVLRELARLLGTSDFLWEDFIRGQYENLLPMLEENKTEFSTDREGLTIRLEHALKGAQDPESTSAALNKFKDTEAYLIDLDHILGKDRDFFFLSSRLSDLAELVVEAALSISWDGAVLRYGEPRSVAGLSATHAVFALGKLGGRAIGYASDLELLFVYSDTGATDGAEKISNNEFYERFFTDAMGRIESKREGIFHIDLRLRPYGNSGPHAVSLETFNRYYGRDGDAHSYEKLALTRLRFIAGDRTLGARVERLRDDLVYGSDRISLADVRDLREKQLAEKESGGRLNAKFSPGGLVDLEYSLQILLVQHGRSHPALRTPSIHSGLQELARAGLLAEEEAQTLVLAYRFLRNLINGLRMLRGNAQDLFLPPVDSPEFAHLARRSGYRRDGDLTATDQLHIEFQARTASVRAFIEHHLGRDSIPGKPAATPADLVYSEVQGDGQLHLITDAGLRDPHRALVNIQSLSGKGSRRDLFGELIGLAWPILGRRSDPDMALNNWDRYTSAVSNTEAHFRSLLRQPVKLRLMLQIFSGSQFLTEILIQTPAFLEWSLDKSVVGSERNRDEMLEDLKNELTDGGDRRAVLRWFRQREILRIGTRDICLGTSIEVITREISALASAIAQADLELIFKERETDSKLQECFCILAFGKLGGGELNYSSDIDLLGVFDDSVAHPDNPGKTLAMVLETLRDDLSSRTEHGHAFRVDFRLRPHGSSGALVQGTGAVERYYRETAMAWEHQALIKLRPVAGTLSVGEKMLDSMRPWWVTRWDQKTVLSGIARMRTQAVRQSLKRGDDIKSGEGGIRDIEFAVQGLQMIHAHEHPEILTGNTFEAVRRLHDAGIISEETATAVAEDYGLLRRIEHYLQLFEDRQIHSLPKSEVHRHALARRIGGPESDPESILTDLQKRREAVHEMYLEFVRTGQLRRSAQDSPSSRRMISGNS